MVQKLPPNVPQEDWLSLSLTLRGAWRPARLLSWASLLSLLPASLFAATAALEMGSTREDGTLSLSLGSGIRCVL